MQNKTCTACHNSKPTNAFYQSKGGKYGVDSRCKKCKQKSDQVRRSTKEYRKRHAAEVQAWRLANPEQYRAYVEANREAIRLNSKKFGQKWRLANPERHLFYKAKYRAKKFCYPFEITLEDIVIPKLCPVLGIEIESGLPSGHYRLATLDKVIPSKGYVKGNIQVISHKANRIKTDASLEELRKVVAYVEKATQSIGL